MEAASHIVPDREPIPGAKLVEGRLGYLEWPEGGAAPRGVDVLVATLAIHDSVGFRKDKPSVIAGGQKINQTRHLLLSGQSLTNRSLRMRGGNSEIRTGN